MAGARPSGLRDCVACDLPQERLTSDLHNPPLPTNTPIIRPEFQGITKKLLVATEEETRKLVDAAMEQYRKQWGVEELKVVMEKLEVEEVGDVNEEREPEVQTPVAEVEQMTETEETNEHLNEIIRSYKEQWGEESLVELQVEEVEEWEEEEWVEEEKAEETNMKENEEPSKTENLKEGGGEKGGTGGQEENIKEDEHEKKPSETDKVKEKGGAKMGRPGKRKGREGGDIKEGPPWCHFSPPYKFGLVKLKARCMVNIGTCSARIKYTRQDLLAHLATCHSTAKYECSKCGKKFVSESTLNNHDQVHSKSYEPCIFGCNRMVVAARMAEH